MDSSRQICALRSRVEKLEKKISDTNGALVIVAIFLIGFFFLFTKLTDIQNQHLAEIGVIETNKPD